jgi:hypothetical protein
VNSFSEKESIPVVSEPPDEYSPRRTWMDLTQEEAELLQLFRRIDNEKIREVLIQQPRRLAE